MSWDCLHPGQHPHHTQGLGRGSGRDQITVECELWCERSYHMYVVRSPMNHTTRTCCLLRAVVSNGTFYVFPLFIRYLHVAADKQPRNMHRYTPISIDMWRYGTLYIQINVCIVLEIDLKECLDMLMICVCCLSICI